MRLTDYLDPGLVVLGFDAPDTESALRSLATSVAAHGIAASKEEIEDALIVRERVHTTVLGEGIAIPHGTVGGIERMHLVVAVAPQGVPFGDDPAEPVRVFFVVLSPPGRQGEHIKLLARVCRLVRHPGFMDQLLTADSADQVISAVSHVDAQHV